MRSTTYPFDPNDWATVTPLFEALSVAPVADGAFLDWLAQWNDLDIAVRDAYTQLKLPAYYDTSDQNADAAYQGYVVELFSTYLGLTNTLMSRALSLHPEPPMPAYQQLWRRWRNLTTLFDPSSLPIQAEISRLEGRYREIMRGYESDPDNPLTYWIDRRDELNDLMMQLLNQRRALAQASGEPCDIQNSAQEEAEAGWQPWNWSLFRIPLYMITYPMAVVGACQVGRLAETDRAVVIGNFKRPMALGNTRSLPDLFNVVGLTFPFTDQAVAETVQDNIAQSLAISNSYR